MKDRPLGLSVILQAVKQSPSAFNSQSARVVILFGADNAKLWSLVWDKVLAAAHFADGQSSR